MRVCVYSWTIKKESAAGECRTRTPNVRSDASSKRAFGHGQLIPPEHGAIGVTESGSRMAMVSVDEISAAAKLVLNTTNQNRAQQIRYIKIPRAFYSLHHLLFLSLSLVTLFFISLSLSLGTLDCKEATPEETKGTQNVNLVLFLLLNEAIVAGILPGAQRKDVLWHTHTHIH